MSSAPLAGQTVVVTRTRAQASKLVEGLAALGAHTIEVPTIEIVAPTDDGAAARAAAADLSRWDWVAITSPNAVERFVPLLGDTDPSATQWAAVGPSTAAGLERHGITVSLVPERFVGEGLVDVFPASTQARTGRVLLPRAEVARDVLPDGLSAAGWTVDIVPVYRTVPAAITDADRRRVGEADLVTFTSSSTVEHFVALMDGHPMPQRVACIGPITAATARDLGLGVSIEATEHTIAGLVAAIAAA